MKHNCNHLLSKLHDSAVTLSEAQRKQMRERRDKCRAYVTERFKQHPVLPAPEFKIQGSYAMHTMVNDPDDHYDIDDGLYFEIPEDTTAKYGAPYMRQLVAEALKDHETLTVKQKKNCVRIFNKKDIKHHVDMAVYRKMSEDDQLLAAGEIWKPSYPRWMTKWLQEECDKLDSAVEDGTAKRMVRFVKYMTHQHKLKDPSGFVLTVMLIKSCPVMAPDRLDMSMASVLVNMHKFLETQGEVCNPHPQSGESLMTCADPHWQNLQRLLDKFVKKLDKIDQGSYVEAAQVWETIFKVEFPDKTDPNVKVNKDLHSGKGAAAIVPGLSLGSTKAWGD
jgi:hypothetical protein